MSAAREFKASHPHEVELRQGNGRIEESKSLWLRFFHSSILVASAIRNTALGLALLVGLTATLLTAAERKFYDDDPIAREVDTEDASGARPWEIDLIWDLTLNTFATPGRATNPPRAGNINTIDEVPDSNWFTNRIGARPLTAAEVARGPVTGDGPAGPLTVIRPKPAGASPGFVARDSRGDVWFISFDADGYPDAATGAVMVANKLFWALGYWQVENHLLQIHPESIAIAETARLTPPSGRRRPMRQSDIDAVLARSHRRPDGSYRAVAAKAIEGTVLGGFRYHGTRPDDPNDIVPHEDRRELRALRVFGAWTNLVDMKAGNTLDTIIEQDGRRVVRHYLQDVGSTFGVGARGPHDYDEGFEFLYEGGTLLKRLVTLGLHRSAWQTARYEDIPAIGLFEADAFDPRTWRPRTPNGAFLRARDDDMFWAARRVAAFSDELIDAAARAGQYGDPAAAPHLARLLKERREKIARAFLPAINPLAEFAIDGGRLTFVNVAEQAGVAAAPGGYRAAWFTFDNATGETRPIGSETSAAGPSIAVPPGLPSSAGGYVKIEVRATESPEASWEVPVDVYFRRLADGWKLVGLERRLNE